MAPTKRNAYILFIEERRAADKRAGGYVARTLEQEVKHYAPDWEALTEEEKQSYKDGASKARQSRPEGEKRRQLTPAEVKEEKVALDSHRTHVSRAKVDKFMKAAGKDWKQTPIVICAFTLRFAPGWRLLYYPAEVGLSAMSLVDGVLDNFARIIDPVNIPLGHGVEASEVCDQLALPELGTVPEFNDVTRTSQAMQKFLEQYCDDSVEEQVVFAFEDEFDVVEGCLDWILENSKQKMRPISVLSLDHYVHCVGMRSPGYTGPEKEINFETAVATNASRKPGVPLFGGFIYPSKTTFPSTHVGFFHRVEDVEKVIRGMDNFKHYDDLACAYHMKMGKPYRSCALSEANRFAFSVLEILTLGHLIDCRVGQHYPDLDNPKLEKARRLSMLGKWDMTDFERDLGFAPVRENPDDRRRRGRDPFIRRWQERRAAAEARGESEEQGTSYRYHRSDEE